MNPITTRPRILLLSRPGSDASKLLSQLPGETLLELVTTFQDALVALRQGNYDLVASDHGDFLALERAAVNQQAAMILETIAQGVCIIDPHGRLIWANSRMRSFPADLLSQACSACARTFGASADPERAKTAHHPTRRFSITAGNDQHFEVTITPVVNPKGEATQVAAVVYDVTHSRRLQMKIDAIDLAGRDMVHLDAETTAAMDVEERISLLEQKIRRYMHDLLEYDNFNVLLIDKKTNRLEVALQHGVFPEIANLDIFASPDNNGISGYVAATGRSYICHDTSKDPRYLKGLEAARSSLTVPLRLHDKIIGVFNIESDRLAAFNEDDRQFAEILARYIAIALNMLDLLVIERYESTGRMAEDVRGEIAGPLNDILTEASTLVEEYIGNDDLRHRLTNICDRVTEIKETLKGMAKSRTGILGGTGQPAVEDPLLGGKRVLVADDEEIIRETICGVLQKQGCEVETAADGNQAIALIERRRYDLVLADIKMPAKTGYEVFAAAKDANPAVAVILMTGFGYDPNHSIVRARREGLNAVLFKPFKVDQLLTEIRSALQAKAAGG